MELGRWGLRKITSFTDRYRDLTDFLTDVLEGERSLLGSEPDAGLEALFRTRDDVERLNYTIDFKRDGAVSVEDRARVAFRASAPFFEAGFLLRTSRYESGLATLDSMFLFGKVFQSGTQSDLRVQLGLPALDDGRVFRGRVAPVLRLFKLEALTLLRDAQAFSFEPAPGFVIVFICNRPHPWQVGVVEGAVLAIRSSLGRKHAP